MTTLRLFLQISSFFWLIASTILARPQRPATSHHPINGVSTRRRKIQRTLESWVIRHNSAKRKFRAPQIKFKDGTGSIITFASPTKERIAQWFGPEEDPENMLKAMLRREFNHDSVGMTNPFLHLKTTCDEEEDLLLSIQKYNMQLTLPVSRTGESVDESSSWWPSLSFNPIRKKGWRVLAYRRQVGRGRDCYERVRNAALDWDFQTQDGLQGLMSIPSSSHLQQRAYSPTMPYVNRGSYSVRSTPTGDPDEPMAFHRSIGSFRRMVSFSASKLPFLKKIYALNPVMVIYDLVDQRAPDTTFTSTAYATMKGHLLRGEERVTVALRDMNENVDVEIISISKSGESLRAKTIWPFIGKMQNKFFQEQMKEFQNVANNDRIK